MSIALATGKAGTGPSIHARILVAARANGVADLTETLTSLGHEVIETETFEGVAEAGDLNHDLLFVDSDLVHAVPDAIRCPRIALIEDGGSAAVAGCAGAVPRPHAAMLAPAFVALAAELRQLRGRCEELERLVGGIRSGSALVGRSPVIRRLLGALSRAADGEATILVEGAPGTGKSLIARAVHCKSRRGNRPIVAVEAADLDGESMSAAFARARGSTLVLENVDQLPQGAQQVLVRFLKERPAGGNATPPARIIATTSAHLPELVARGAFREDLYYRLHVLPLVMPALRERVEDIALLAKALLDQCASHGSPRPAGFTPAALSVLESMSWPGNVTQLEATIQRAYLAAAGAPIDREHLSGPAMLASRAATTAAVAAAEEEVTEESIRPFDEEEQLLLSRALRATRGNVRRAAQLLGIGRATLYRKIQQYRLRLQ